MQTCTKCKEEKPLTDFPPNRRYKSGRHSWCKPCKARLVRSNYSPERRKLLDASARLWRHGLTQEQYDFMLMCQDWRCAVCRNELPPEPEPHIDHDHRCCPAGRRTCGRCTRGLLCMGCNIGIGHMVDSSTVLRAAADYLDSWSDSGI